MPVGRLPTTPAAAARAVVRFTAFDGRLAPVTAATSGYDFLTDGAQQVDAALRSIPGVLGANPPGLIGDTWTKADSARRHSCPAASRATSRRSTVMPTTAGSSRRRAPRCFEIGDLPPVTGGPIEAYDRKLVFSMGCHAGLSVSDVFVVSPLGTADWPQAYTQRGGTYAGSSGYAYGDGKLVAYSEDLHRRFAENIGGLAAPGDLTIGQAMVLAKQDYFGELGLVGVYDEKASSEFTLYGLPMWQIGGTAPAAAPASAPAAAAAATVEPAPRPRRPSASSRRRPTRSSSSSPTTGLTAEQLTSDWTPPTATPVSRCRLVRRRPGRRAGDALPAGRAEDGAAGDGALGARRPHHGALLDEHDALRPVLRQADRRLDRDRAACSTGTGSCIPPSSRP